MSLKTMLNEFRDFAIKGNMIDMAVGIIIGAAFGTVIKSLVADVIMPPIGVLLGGVDFSALGITLQEAAAGKEAVAIKYGAFLNNLFSFVVVAFCVFMLVKAVNQLKARFEEEKVVAPSEPPRQEVLLKEIRDALTNKN